MMAQLIAGSYKPLPQNRLIELLDPQAITHYEFFLRRSPITGETWESDAKLLAAIPEPSPCIQGWRDGSQ
jgi:hypothetical protein